MKKTFGAAKRDHSGSVADHDMPHADPAGALLDIDDEVLASVAGGCCYPGQTTALCSPCPPQYCL